MFPLRDTIPSRRAPVVLWLLLLANVLVFVYELQLGETGLKQTIERYAIVPVRLEMTPHAFLTGPGSYVTLVTSMFLHGGFLHLLGNMWTLAIFGDNVEDRMGKLRFLVFYLVCGIVAGVVHVYFNAASTVPTIGASGAISGVMGAYLVLYPRARVITLIPLLFYPLFVELPAYVFLGVWFTAQILSGAARPDDLQEAGGIAFLAHVGGFVAGVLLHWLFLQPQRRVRGA
jgi:membrane associated rhomboid family serine protease